MESSFNITGIYSKKNVIIWKQRIKQRTESVEYALFCARIASFDKLDLIGDPLMFSNFHNGIHDSKGQENIIYIIIKEILLYNFHREHILLKLKTKKLL